MRGKPFRSVGAALAYAKRLANRTGRPVKVVVPNPPCCPNPRRRRYPKKLAAKYIRQEFKAGRKGKQAIAIGIARARRRRNAYLPGFGPGAAAPTSAAVEKLRKRVDVLDRQVTAQLAARPAVDGNLLRRFHAAKGALELAQAQAAAGKGGGFLESPVAAPRARGCGRKAQQAALFTAAELGAPQRDLFGRRNPKGAELAALSRRLGAEYLRLHRKDREEGLTSAERRRMHRVELLAGRTYVQAAARSVRGLGRFSPKLRNPLGLDKRPDYISPRDWKRLGIYEAQARRLRRFEAGGGRLKSGAFRRPPSAAYERIRELGAAYLRRYRVRPKSNPSGYPFSVDPYEGGVYRPRKKSGKRPRIELDEDMQAIGSEHISRHEHETGERVELPPPRPRPNTGKGSRARRRLERLGWGGTARMLLRQAGATGTAVDPLYGRSKLGMQRLMRQLVRSGRLTPAQVREHLSHGRSPLPNPQWLTGSEPHEVAGVGQVSRFRDAHGKLQGELFLRSGEAPRMLLHKAISNPRRRPRRRR